MDTYIYTYIDQRMCKETINKSKLCPNTKMARSLPTTVNTVTRCLRLVVKMNGEDRVV